MRRPALLLLAATALLAAAGASRAAASEARAGTLLEAARALATAPYAAPAGRLPPPFAGLTYDQYRAIRPLPGVTAMLPLGRHWTADLLPPGLYFPDPVAIELPAEGGGFAGQSFAPNRFDFDPDYFDAVPASAPGAGFSGLRLRYPLNSPGVNDEVMVMQGASYFRAIGRAMVYGLSARAAALGTGGPGPEEFPRFVHLRLHPAEDDTMRLEAVIDSPSLAGHLAMTLHPGEDTAMDIVVTLLPRRELTDLGVAPLTSMFLKGPLRAAVSDDYRPRVHDSNVLIMENGAGEALWRPIANPARLQTSAFLDDSPVAFGLWQTPRRFEDYQDNEARYHDRPSARVVPAEAWGPGAVVLVEIPTDNEFMDNVVAFWRPAQPLAKGSEHRFAYRLNWTRGEPRNGAGRSILQSRAGREHDQVGARRFIVDFAGRHEDLVPELSVTDGAAVSGTSVFPLHGGRASRVTFLLHPGDRQSAELRLQLRDAAGVPASPVWLYRWTRARDGGV
ncbi:glucan biosynthesis protein [Pseudohaliea rubra]|uniref:Glucans biosynthesis protein G n=1 Tax=Pseudohaliea rubra DSM 19751 TaxID=1265313 RepID=A0A095WVG8_9GAMM|nr:glucan biosynthesis protein [Pseudohaliea rubra]KGE02629.1 Glucans biosynthesis protein G precursor [Pseudohaliea rubra DSM 19751]